MEAEGKTRRGCLTINAVDPTNGKTYEVLISYEKMHKVCSRSKGQVLDCAKNVPYTLQHPLHIYEGLCRDEDEKESDDVGWRCYCCVPPHAYSKDGSEREPWPNQVFLVFVNAEKIAYNWYWHVCDEGSSTHPKSYQTRFVKEVL
jgi:hypothetical protein